MKKLLLLTSALSVLAACSPAPEEMGKVENTFAALDKDNNSFISKEEANGEAVSRHFADIDADGNQKLSKSEFEGFLASNPNAFKDDITQTAQQGSEGDIQPEKALPEDGDNEIDKAERKLSDKELLAMAEFDRMDVDRSGDLTKSEAMRSGLNEAFSDMDDDDDQVISKNEYLAFFDNRSSAISDSE